jgi:hypothetical protein
MLGHAHQTGALHLNAGATDAVLFFDAGTITHAECGNLFGDEAVIHIVKSCIHGGAGVYKFVYGATSPQHTVLRSATDLMLDAMREYDESSNNATEVNAVLEHLANANLEHADLLGEDPADHNATDQQRSEDKPPDEGFAGEQSAHEKVVHQDSMEEKFSQKNLADKEAL